MRRRSRFSLFRSGHAAPTQDIAPDEIFLDDRNIPNFDLQQFEGQIERPIPRRTLFLLFVAFLAIAGVFVGRAGYLQVYNGDAYAALSERNRLEYEYLFPERGVITDRNGIELAWNIPPGDDQGFSLRQYIARGGFGHILGYLRYPARDASGVFYRTDYEAVTGVEFAYNETLKGKRGLRIIETDALGTVVSQSVIDPPKGGADLALSIDARVQSILYDRIREVALAHGFTGGAAGIIDVATGELIALTSFPEYDPNVMTSAKDVERIGAYQSDSRMPFLHRAVSGLYTPGSIVKPIYALGAYNDGLITPEKKILSTGSISIPNPYNPKEESVFNDWKAHGWLDMKQAIGWSSNVYFYEIGGGYKDQKGLGISGIEKYARMFGFGTTTGIELPGERIGTIPNPSWKAKVFPEDPTWRVGDTYFTAIGQYGMQITLIQALKEASIIASKGLIPTPTLRLGSATSTRRVAIPPEKFAPVHDGMRIAVVEGTSKILNIPEVNIAAKSGTAELGVKKDRWNSWVIGFFPYEEPRYAFAFVMERGPVGNTFNASYVASLVFRDIAERAPEYLARKKNSGKD
jgi:penicillin-binding protein 2